MHKKPSALNHTKLNSEETNKLVAAYARSRRDMKQNNGSPKYTEEMVNQWSNELRNALRRIDQQSVEHLRNAFESDMEVCVYMLADIANDQYKPKKWANSQTRYVGVSNSNMRG